jgi:hypothetical protein
VKTLLLALLAGASVPADGADGVSAFHCQTPQQVTRANVREVYAAHGTRSVVIVRTALAGDAARLSQMVAPDAKFTVFEGDVGIGPRSAGVEAAIAFARQIAPQGYRFSAGSAGPVAMDPCDTAIADLTLIGERPGEAVIARFTYRDGFLIGVEGSRVELVGGDFPSAAKP